MIDRDEIHIHMNVCCDYCGIEGMIEDYDSESVEAAILEANNNTDWEIGEKIMCPQCKEN